MSCPADALPAGPGPVLSLAMPAAGGTRGRRHWLILLLGIVLLSGCISEDREQVIGQEMASEVNPHLPMVEDPLLNSYISAVGARLAQVSERPDLNFHFYIIDTDAVNAFALPGGYIYLTRGLIERTETGSEFAGVLAHEIGHVAARHGIRKLERQLRTGSVVNVLYNTILGGEPELLRDNSLQLADLLWSARHSRKDEEEADRLAVRYLLRAGVDPEGIVTLLSSLLAEEQASSQDPGKVEVWFSTHPLTADRIREAERMIENLSSRERPRIELDLHEYQAFKSLLGQSSYPQSYSLP